MAIIIAKSHHGRNKDEVWKELCYYLDRCDGLWSGRYAGFMREALKSIEDTVRYEKIIMRDSKIGPHNPLVKRYFTQVKGGSPQKNPDEYVLAHNGWTMITEDFGARGAFHYLRRVVYAWEDSIKLYYGTKKEDSPYLWSHMEKYVGYIATTFQGIRIDNCHSTPIHVLEYFVNYARSLNPHLFVIAELFSYSGTTDALYAKRVGLNAMIREAIYVPFSLTSVLVYGRRPTRGENTSDRRGPRVSNGQGADRAHPAGRTNDPGAAVL